MTYSLIFPPKIFTFPPESPCTMGVCVCVCAFPLHTMKVYIIWETVRISPLILYLGTRVRLAVTLHSPVALLIRKSSLVPLD